MNDDRFVPAAPLADIPDGGYVDATLGGHAMLIANLGGEPFAIEDVCSHADSPLRGGRLRHGRIGCPLHGAIFDFRTGAAIGGGLAPCGLRTFACRVIDGTVEVAPEPRPALPR